MENNFEALLKEVRTIKIKSTVTYPVDCRSDTTETQNT